MTNAVMIKLREGPRHIRVKRCPQAMEGSLPWLDHCLALEQKIGQIFTFCVYSPFASPSSK